MPQYLLSVYHVPGDQAAGAAYADDAAMQAAFAAVGAFNERLMSSGAWVMAGGLTPPEEAAVVDATGEHATTTDGPLPQADRLLGGFWVVEAADRAAALALGAEASAACGQRVEVRPLQG